LKEKLSGEQVDLLLSRVRHPVRELLDRSGVTPQLGAENFHVRTIDGVLAYVGKYHEQLGAEYETFVEGLRSLLVTLDAQIAQAEGREKEWLMATRTRLENMARKAGADDVAQAIDDDAGSRNQA
jgi:hypothetical protein